MSELVRFTVKGIVQGVGFRYFVNEFAAKLNIDGFVKNLENGDVEIVVCADKEKIILFEKAVRKGPLYSRVDDIIVDKINLNLDRKGFHIIF